MNLTAELREVGIKAANYLRSLKYPIQLADPKDEDFHELALDLPNTVITEDFGYDDLAIYGIELDGTTPILLTYNKESTNLGKMDIHYLPDWDMIYLAQYLYDNHR